MVGSGVGKQFTSGRIKYAWRCREGLILFAKLREREYELSLKRPCETHNTKKEMNREDAVKAAIYAASFPVALLLAHKGYTGALWVYLALVAGLAVVWILQGLFRKSG